MKDINCAFNLDSNNFEFFRLRGLINMNQNKFEDAIAKND